MPKDTWHRLPDARRQAVLDAAEREFAAHGFSQGSLNVIAREAGVAKGSLFQYFDDKADLFTHICERAADRVAAAMDAHTADIDWSAGFFAGYERFLDAWVEHFQTHPVDRALSAAVVLEPDPAARSAVRRVVDRRELDFLEPLVRAARDQGWLRPDADLEAFAALQLLVLPHLALAPSHPELDPVLGLGGPDTAGAVRRVLRVFETAFGAPAREPVATGAP